MSRLYKRVFPNSFAISFSFFFGTLKFSFNISLYLLSHSNSIATSLCIFFLTQIQSQHLSVSSFSLKFNRNISLCLLSHSNSFSTSLCVFFLTQIQLQHLSVSSFSLKFNCNIFLFLLSHSNSIATSLCVFSLLHLIQLQHLSVSSFSLIFNCNISLYLLHLLYEFNFQCGCQLSVFLPAVDIYQDMIVALEG